jgi:diazepam-binding inhibitor (GABA receptor modulator, acyl-CoA-binding protein)
MALQEDFQKASQDVQSLKKKPSDGELLELYSLFKQAKDGDANGSRPGIFDIVGRKKFDSWAAKKGMSKDDAMQKYIAFVQQLQTRG